jgi:hypothetical protein
MNGPDRDCFALFGLARQPWLDPDALKAQFLADSSRSHPDKLDPQASPGERESAAARFSDLNVAYQTLRDTRARLAHLLELETGASPGKVEQVTSESADLFFHVGGLCRQIDGFLAERARAASALMKASLFAQGLGWTARVQELQQILHSAQAGMDDELRVMNALWLEPSFAQSPARAQALARLTAIYRQLSYYSRWNSQLQERLVQLAS